MYSPVGLPLINFTRASYGPMPLGHLSLVSGTVLQQVVTKTCV